MGREHRITSTAAYEALMANKRLRGMRGRVYHLLFHHGPLTGGELNQRYRDLYKPNIPSINTWTRLTELRNMGLVEEKGERKCEVTGHDVIEWDVTDRPVPLPLPKPTIHSVRKELARHRVAVYILLTTLNDKERP